jgi:tetratricopeptide (TPR) repeat protein
MSQQEAGAQQTIRSGKVAATSAKIYIDYGKWDDALSSIEQGLAVEPENAELHELLGRVCAEKSQYAKADSAYKKCLLLDPTRAAEVEKMRERFFRILMRDGLLALKENKTDEAEAKFRGAVDFWPEKPEAHIQLGVICFDKQDYPCALERFKAARMITPEDPVVLRDLATSYSLFGQPDSALAAYRALLVIEPNDFEAKNAIATIFLNTGKYDMACALFDSILAGKEIDDLNTFYNAGVAYAQTKQFDKAANYFAKVLALAKDDVDAMVNLYMIYMQTNEYEKAVPLLEDLTKRDAQNAEYWSHLSIAYLQTKREAEAQAADKKYKELTGGK